MSVHKALHSVDDIDRLNVSGDVVERGLTITEECVYGSIQELEKYIKVRKDRLITAASDRNGNISTKRKTTKYRKQIRRKTTVWIFEVADCGDCTQEDMN